MECSNPLYLYTFLNLKDKVMEGMERGFGFHDEKIVEMRVEKVLEYAQGQHLHFVNADEKNRINVGRDGILYSCESGKKNFVRLYNTWNHKEDVLDLMDAALLGESREVFLWGMEHHQVVDCGVQATRDCICACRNEEMLETLFAKEYTVFWLDPEDALNHMNPVLLRLMYERKEKIFTEDIYDLYMNQFVLEYYDGLFACRKGSVSGQKEGILVRDLQEVRTDLEFIMDFIMCMKYLRKQGYRGGIHSIAEKEKLTEVLEDLKKYSYGNLYQEFLELL